MSAPRLAATAVPRAVQLLADRPDLVDVHAVADVLDQTARWSA